MPFGARSAPPEAADTPPSAADFWGERAASIHDAVQAPADDESDQPPDPPLSGPARGRGRLAAAASLAMAIVAALAIASGLTGQTSRKSGAPKTNMATVLSTNLSRILERGLAGLDVRAASSHAAVAEHHVRVAHRTPRNRPVFRRVHEPPSHQLDPSVSYAASASEDVSSASAVTTIHQPTPGAASSGTSDAGTPTTRAVSPPAPTHPPRSSPAAVSPTGQSGALGPIQSPNG